MAVNARNGIAFSGVSHINGIAKASIGALNGQTRASSGTPFDLKFGANTGDNYGMQARSAYSFAADNTQHIDHDTIDVNSGDSFAALRADFAALHALGTVTVTSATLYLPITQTFGGARTLTVHQCLRAWLASVGVGGLTWNQYDSSLGSAPTGAWATAGGSGSGDQSVSALGSNSVDVPSTGLSWLAITLTASVVQDQINAVVPNNGYLVRSDGFLFVNGPTATDATARPYLRVIGTV